MNKSEIVEFLRGITETADNVDVLLETDGAATREELVNVVIAWGKYARTLIEEND